MIKRFLNLKDLPYTLTQPMYREFQAKQRDLQRWNERSRSSRIQAYLRQREAIEYFFALGIYYFRYVIAPLTRTRAFFDRIQTLGDASAVVVGGRTIGPDYRRSISRAEKHFAAVLRDYGLDERFFALTDVKQIVMSLIRIDERRQDGAP